MLKRLIIWTSRLRLSWEWIENRLYISRNGFKNKKTNQFKGKQTPAKIVTKFNILKAFNYFDSKSVSKAYVLYPEKDSIYISFKTTKLICTLDVIHIFD